jgi:hypothetical protein
MKKLKIGDIFTIPVSDDKNGFGQIIKIPNKHNFIIIVFDGLYSGFEWPSTNEIIQNKILFLGYTMDALFYHEYWNIIGNEFQNLEKIELPYFKLGTTTSTVIVDYKGDKVRKATKIEDENLSYLTVSAPICYELALKAYYKLEDWIEEYNNYFYSKTMESIKIVEGINGEKGKKWFNLW